MKIFIGFSAPNKWEPFSWLIQSIESRQYDHVYIRVQDPITQNWMIFQASSLMVNMESATTFLTKNVSYKEYEYDCTDAQFKMLWNFIDSELGTPYSLIEDFGILLMKIFKLKNNPFTAGTSEEFCSKLGATVCQMLGLNIPEDASSIDPSALDTILGNLKLPCVLNPTI